MIKLNTTDKTVQLWTVALVIVSFLLVVNMFNVPIIDVLGPEVATVWHSMLLILIAGTLFLEVVFGKKGFELNKPGDIFIGIATIAAFILAFQVMGLMTIPILIQPYVALIYLFVVTALIYSIKVE